MANTIPCSLTYSIDEYDDRDGHLLLHAVDLGAPHGCAWSCSTKGSCGGDFATPIVTAAEFSRWISAQHANDANGIWGWGPDGVTEGDGAMVYRDEEHREPDDRAEVFPVVGVHEGVPVYAIEGWEFFACDACQRYGVPCRPGHAAIG